MRARAFKRVMLVSHATSLALGDSTEMGGGVLRGKLKGLVARKEMGGGDLLDVGAVRWWEIVQMGRSVNRSRTRPTEGILGRRSPKLRLRVDTKRDLSAKMLSTAPALLSFRLGEIIVEVPPLPIALRWY